MVFFLLIILHLYFPAIYYNGIDTSPDFFLLSLIVLSLNYSSYKIILVGLLIGFINDLLISTNYFGFITIIYALFFTQPVYTSTSKIMSSSSGGDGVSQAVGLAAQFGINIPTSQSEPKWTYPEIMKSRTVAREVLKRKFDSNKKCIIFIHGAGMDHTVWFQQSRFFANKGFSVISIDFH